MIGWISIGGVIGALSRYYMGRWVSQRTRLNFPLGTLIINASGSFLLGVVYALHSQQVMSEELWLVLGIGFCGSYTTFSTFGYETLRLIENKRWQAAAWYVVVSVGLGLMTAWLGLKLIS